MHRGGDCKRQGKYRLGGADQRVVRQLVSAWLVLPPIMNTVQHLIRRAYGLLVTGANFLQPPVVAIQEGLCRSRRTSFSRNQMQLAGTYK